MNKFYVAFASLLLLLTVKSALACSCLPPKSPCEELKEADAVFSGKVLEIKRNERGPQIRLEVTFEVDQAWKGVSVTTIRVFTNSNSAACGYNFQKNQSYLVYAYGKDGELSTFICSRTKRLEDAGDDLRALGKGSRPGG